MIAHRLAQTRDEVEILELLHLRSHDLVVAFEDRIVEYADKLEAELVMDDPLTEDELDEDNR